MRPLLAEDSFVVGLTAAVQQALRGLEPVQGWPAPSTFEVAALCNTALQLCVGRYEGDPLFTTLLLFDGASGRTAPGFMRLASGPDWRALARGFPEGIATRVEGGQLRPFAGLTVPLDDSHTYGLPITRALVLPGVVGVTIGGELLAELRPGQEPQVLEVPRPSLDSLLAEAGLPRTAGLRPSHLRRILQAARQHRHGASLVVASGPMRTMPDAPPLAGAAVDWTDLKEALAAQATTDERPGAPAESRIREHEAEAVRLADALGRLTAVDGALMLSHDGLVFGFGLRLGAPSESGGVTVMYSDRLGDKATTRRENPATGSRRRSAVDYVAAHPGCFALVLSSDGPLSLVCRRDEKTVLVQRGLECLL